MDHNAEDCPVCLITFDDTLRRPRTLPCDHTFCTPCINGLEDQGQVTCPTCRSAHTVPKEGQFPVSYITEAFIRRLRGEVSACPPPRQSNASGEPASSQACGPRQEKPVGISRPIRSMLEEQEAKVMAAIHTCQEMQAQLDRYQTTLEGWGEQDLENRLQALVNQMKCARVLVHQEESKVKKMNEHLQQGEQQLHALLQELRMVTTEQEAGIAFVNAARCTDEERQKMEECQGMFPDLHTVTTISKARTASGAALEVARYIHEALETTGVAEDIGLPPSQDLPVTDKLEAVQAPTMTVEDLLSLAQPTRRMLQAGLMFAIHQVEERNKQARITLEDNHLFLHYLREQSLPPFAITMQVVDVVPPSPPCLVFLDLEWPGTTLHRVLIRLSPNTPMARQFLLLCTGQRGPCYANTNLFEVVNRGTQGEFVRGGDYDGTGGAALLPDLADSVYRKSSKAGAVFRTIHKYDFSNWNAQFGIRTRDFENGMQATWVFGEVEAGLDALVAAAQHSNIKEVTVVDCGVVLL